MDRYDWCLNVREYGTKMYYYTVMDLEVNQWRYMDIGDALQIFKIKSDKLLLLRKKEYLKKISLETRALALVITETGKNYLSALIYFNKMIS